MCLSISCYFDHYFVLVQHTWQAGRPLLELLTEAVSINQSKKQRTLQMHVKHLHLHARSMLDVSKCWSERLLLR